MWLGLEVSGSGDTMGQGTDTMQQVLDHALQRGDQMFPRQDITKFMPGGKHEAIGQANATYTINYDGGSETIQVNQR